MLRQIHTLAKASHWSERDIVSLALGRRMSYLLMLEADRDARLVGGVTGE